MNNPIKAIHVLEDKLKEFILKYEFLKQENEVLHQNCSEFKSLLKEKQQEIENQKKKYELLKVAKTIEGGRENKRDTKLKINALIRKIDKCIILLDT